MSIVRQIGNRKGWMVQVVGEDSAQVLTEMRPVAMVARVDGQHGPGVRMFIGGRQYTATIEEAQALVLALEQIGIRKMEED